VVETGLRTVGVTAMDIGGGGVLKQIFSRSNRSQNIPPKNHVK